MTSILYCTAHGLPPPPPTKTKVKRTINFLVGCLSIKSIGSSTAIFVLFSGSLSSIIDVDFGL